MFIATIIIYIHNDIFMTIIIIITIINHSLSGLKVFIINIKETFSYNMFRPTKAIVSLYLCVCVCVCVCVCIYIYIYIYIY